MTRLSRTMTMIIIIIIIEFHHHHHIVINTIISARDLPTHYNSANDTLG